MERAELMELLRATGCAEEHGDCVLLQDPNQPSAFPDATNHQSAIANRQSPISLGWLCVATGGSSGVRKFARHDEATLGAAVEGLRRHFDLERVNAVDVLPPYHVSGLMARVRAAATGGEHLAWDWKRLAAGELPPLPPRADGWVISLVPTQLQHLRSVAGAMAWLRGLRVIFVGGGPIWPDLAEAAALAELPVALTYGMTETAAMVAAQRPRDFLAGDRTCGTALPHAHLAIDEEGVVRVSGQSVFHGYWPEWRDERSHVTDDLGAIDERGRLRIHGRRDAVIITGGKKVQPADVEAVLRSSGECTEIAVIGVPDTRWGEMVVACYPGVGGRAPNPQRAAEGLAPHERPKRWLALDVWPVNAQGKVNRRELRTVAAAKLGLATGPC